MKNKIRTTKIINIDKIKDEKLKIVLMEIGLDSKNSGLDENFGDEEIDSNELRKMVEIPTLQIENFSGDIENISSSSIYEDSQKDINNSINELKEIILNLSKTCNDTLNLMKKKFESHESEKRKKIFF